MIADFDAAYANSAAIRGAADILRACGEAAAAFRATTPGRAVRYGTDPREVVDLFVPSGQPRGLVVFVHGGYWRAFDQHHWSHLAAGCLAHGWAVAMPGYPLCPGVRIAQITRSIAQAVTAAAAEIAGPVVLSGHSAGGQLAARMVCADTALPEAVAARVARVVGISGVYDLRPLLRTAMNADLRLDLAEARAESPLLAEPRSGVRLTAWVGAAELPEFRRQNRAMASLWHGLGAWAEAVEAPERHHFDVIDALAEPDSALVARLVGADAAG